MKWKVSALLGILQAQFPGAGKGAVSMVGHFQELFVCLSGSRGVRRT